MLLSIEKMIYGGEGLARLPLDSASDASELPHVSRKQRSKHGPPQSPSRGKAVFVPFVLPGETIEASIAEVKPAFVRATADSIIEPSPHRIQPACPYFTRCGGCHYQHADYEHQLEIKKGILKETFRRVAKLELACEIEMHASPAWNYRNRSRLQVRMSPAFVVGYFMGASQQVLAVEECPISSPLINRGIAVMWELGRSGNVPGGVQEIEFFADSEDSQMLAEVYCQVETRRASVREFVEALRAAVPEIAGVVAVRAQCQPSRTERARNAAPVEFEKIVSNGEDSLTYRTANAGYRVSAGSFFQTNRFLIDELVRIVSGGRSGELALDLYAGVGLFSTALAGDIRHIVSVESSQTSTGDLSYNQPANVEAVQATTEQYLAGRENSGRFGKGAVLPHTSYQPDLAVVDPPRSGLGERVARLLAKLSAPVLVYVSCDPATLARDLVPLLASGYRVDRAHMVDLFPQTYHIESVLELRK